MSGATLLRPVARRTLPLRTEAELVAGLRARDDAWRVAGDEIPAHTPAASARGDSPVARAARTTTSREPAAPGGVTLDELLSGAWEALLAHESAPCPVCGGAMRPRYGSGPAVVGGRCGRCATALG